MSENQSEYERLVGPIEERMIRSVWRIVRDPDDFDDAFQEALATVWRRLDQIRRHANPQALILRICVNAAYDALRRKSLQRRREALSEITDAYPDASPSVAERLAGGEAHAEIMRAIATLPRKQAEAALMRFTQELPYAEIAQALGCSEVTARTHVARARERLSRLLAHLAPFAAAVKEVAL